MSMKIFIRAAGAVVLAAAYFAFAR